MSTLPTRRLSGATGVTPTKRISFRWNGRRMQGVAGDTLASALLANGVRIVGRGFKYHRPRGVTSAGVEEAGAIVTVGRGARRTANVNAATAPLYEGMEAEGQNAWPAVGFDFGRVNDLAGRFLSAGFYYKTFFSLLPSGVPGAGRGTRDWMLYEKAIRQAAGMGRATRDPDPDAYETLHAFCDVLVVGSGPAGLAAAEALAEAGEDVVLVDQDFALGGRLLADGDAIEGAAPIDWRDARLAAIEAAGARVWASTCAFGLYDHGMVGLVRQGAPGAARGGLREQLIQLRVKRIVLATGAIERGLTFFENDRPGVMTAGALRSYVGRFGVLPGKRIAVATTNDGAYRDLDRLVAAGAEVSLIDVRPAGSARRAAGAPGVAHRTGLAPARALGDGGVRGVELAALSGEDWRIAERLGCDILAVSGGWSPTLHLASQRGMKPVWDDAAQAFLPADLPEHETPIEIAGAAAGLSSAEDCVLSGRNAAARLLGRAEQDLVGDGASPAASLFAVETPDRRGKAFIDLLHDVTLKDVRLAHQEGYVSPEHLKRYTTLGMAPDQGKTSNVAGLAALSEAQGLAMGSVGTTTFRPPYTPVSLGALAGARRGRHLNPERRTPMHDWNLEQGAVMMDAGLWRRPWYYPSQGETLAAAYVREADITRKTVGLCDVTSLGKISVQGPDAAEFLNRIYVNGFAKLPIGRARYGVMLREDGFVYDDGTVWRLGEQDYFMTTTTAGAGKVMSWLEKLLETRWSDLRVTIASVSEAWAGMAVAGPLARRLLERVVEGVDFADEAFPFMGVREGTIGGVACRVARISFSGELAYEIYVESDFGAALAEALWAVAKPWGGVLYGTESLGALRIEKGHVAGAELDGRTTLDDLGLGAMASSKKPFIGSALMDRQAMAAPDRPVFVGLIAREGEPTFSNGAILCDEEEIEGHGLGWVSSVTWSPALDAFVGLGFLQGGHEAWAGKTVVAADPARGKQSRLRVVSPHLFDPENLRLKPKSDPEAPASEGLARPASFARRSPLGSDWSRLRETGGTPALLGRDERLGRQAETLEAQDGDGAVWMVEGRPESVWRLSAWPGAHAEAAALADRAASAEGARALRLGPLDWRVHGADAAGVEQLTSCPGSVGATLDIGHSLTRIRLGGAEVEALLNRFVALDLREQAFPVGKAAAISVEHLPASLHRAASQVFDLWVPRSYAASIWPMLAEAAERLNDGKGAR